jgi:hypothetical protein
LGAVFEGIIFRCPQEADSLREWKTRKARAKARAKAKANVNANADSPSGMTNER